MKDWIKQHVVDLVMVSSISVIVACVVWLGVRLETRENWVISREPMTAEERAAVAAMTERILSATPRQLAGHDQDWDDAVRAAHRAACETHCAPRLFEYRGPHRTGQWKAISSGSK